MKTPTKQAILTLAAAILLWLIFLLLLGFFINFFSMPVEEEPLHQQEEASECNEESNITPYLSEISISPSDLYSIYWEEKDVARWILDNKPDLTIAEALDLVDLTKEITESTSELDYRYILAIMKVESGFCSDAISPSGAVGYMQLIPKWFVQRGWDHGFTYIFPPEENITLGVEYLDEMYQETGDLRLATMGYNMGLDEARSVYDGTANGYVQLVENAYNDLLERVS